MTNEEVKKLFNIIKSVYETFSPMNLEVTAKSWAIIMQDVSYIDAQKAFFTYSRINDTGFAPTPGQLLACLEKSDATNDGGMTEIEAWKLVCKAAQRGNYYSEEDFKSLPPLVQKVLGGPYALIHYANLDEVNMEKEHITFAQNFKAVKERQKEIKLVKPIDGTTNVIEELEKRKKLLEQKEPQNVPEKSEPQKEPDNPQENEPYQADHDLSNLHRFQEARDRLLKKRQENA